MIQEIGIHQLQELPSLAHLSLDSVVIPSLVLEMGQSSLSHQFLQFPILNSLHRLNSTTPLRSPKAGLFSRELPKARGEEMDQDAPPVESLGEMDGNDSMSSSPRRTADVS